MSDYLSKIKGTIRMLSVSIYTGERLERNLRVMGWIGLVISAITAVTTTMNILQKKGFVTVTTALFCLLGLALFAEARLFRRRDLVVGTSFFMFATMFTYYTVCGVNEGFATLWTLIVPLAFCYFASVKSGIILSFYFEILYVLLFYTPLRSYVEGYYSETFMNRMPVLYLCGVLLNSIAMIQYHLTAVRQTEYEAKLKSAADAAIAADMAKSQFLAQMSHEIRTPINAVLGMNEMIIREAKDEDILDYADDIRSAGNTLLSLINSILDFSKIEDGKMELVNARYDTKKLIKNVVASVAERAKAKGLAFIVNVDETIPTRLYGDDVRLSQIIVNLLTNAVKYTEEGSVTLSFGCEKKKDNTLSLEVKVKDTGIGIRQEDMDKLTVSFERLDLQRNRHIEGTGLGMSIVTELLSLMGSEIHVESVYGQGSEFSFTVEQKIVDPKPIGDYEKAVVGLGRKHEMKETISAPKAQILVVDDNEMNLKVARNLLRLCNIHPDTASSGAEAIKLMSERTYDIVLLDHMMPKMDGIETLVELKNRAYVPENTVMIALTANAVSGAREMYLNAGFDDYLSKPMDIGDLTDALSTYLPASAYEQEAKAAAEDTLVLEFFPDEESFENMNRYDTNKLALCDVDTGTGLRYCGGDEDVYNDVLSDYVKSYEEKRDALNEAFEKKDWHDYQVTVHALKSTSKTIGAATFATEALGLELAAKDSDEIHISENHATVMQHYDTLVKGIRSAEID
ncbi:MAG: response regulator [Lachnospiraceae bacterium]|nr:response regulator [Lachnospiraceae bacterium]